MLRTKRVSDFVWFCFLFDLGLELSDVKFSPIPSMTVNSISSTAHTQRICTGFAATHSQFKALEFEGLQILKLLEHRIESLYIAPFVFLVL